VSRGEFLILAIDGVGTRRYYWLTQMLEVVEFAVPLRFEVSAVATSAPPRAHFPIAIFRRTVERDETGCPIYRWVGAR
jgi:hypothetical protein